MDGDGSLHSDKEEGNFHVLCYNPDTEARLVSTVALCENSNHKFRKYYSIDSFVIADNETYESNIGAAVRTLSIRKGDRGKLGKEIKKLAFAAPVKQVISCRHHTGGDAEQDDIYVLLCDGDLFKVN